MLLSFPNQLTLLRMGFIPLFIISLIYDRSGYALLLFLLAGITDALDGLLARRLNQKTALGAFLDPIADKFLVTTAFILLSIPSINPLNTIPMWLTTLVISRDVLIVLAALIIHMAYGRRSFAPSIFGKAATVVYIMAVFLVLLFDYLEVRPPFLSVLFFLILGVTLVSGFHYLATLPRLASNGGQ